MATWPLLWLVAARTRRWLGAAVAGYWDSVREALVHQALLSVGHGGACSAGGLCCHLSCRLLLTMPVLLNLQSNRVDVKKKQNLTAVKK